MYVAIMHKHMSVHYLKYSLKNHGINELYHKFRNNPGLKINRVKQWTFWLSWYKM